MQDGCTLLLHDALYAPKIRRNLLSLVMLLRVGFNLILENNSIFILFWNSHITDMDGFMILAIDYSNFDNSVVLLTLSENVSNGSIICHARFGHIWQDRMARLRHEDSYSITFIDNFTRGSPMSLKLWIALYVT